jgi:hypothetical protein
MKEVAAIEVQLAATESPVRPQNKMKSKNPVLGIVQHSTADQAKVGHVVFPLPRIAPPAIAAPAELERNRAHVIRVNGELPKTIETGAKNRAIYAIARRFPSVMVEAHTKSLAIRA